MPEQETLERAHEDERQGKSPPTQAGEFVREEIEHVRKGKHGARSAKQAIAIGLSKARRAGIKLPAPGRRSSAATRRKAAKDKARGKHPHKPSRRRSRAIGAALKRESRRSVSRRKLARQARSSARRRTRSQRSAASGKAARTRARRRRR